MSAPAPKLPGLRLFALLPLQLRGRRRRSLWPTACQRTAHSSAQLEDRASW